jgi:prepilin-type N-terminal cleavage/methylation domain-containing protein
MSHGPSLNKDRAMSLMELLVALVLFSLIVLGIGNIETFCRHVFTGSDRKAKVINEASYVIEHMSKFIGNAVGNSADVPVNLTPPAMCSQAATVWTDYDPAGAGNGIKDANDRQILYCFNSPTHTLSYYSNYTTALPGTSEILARNIATFTIAVVRNTVAVSIIGCWNASVPTASPKACGSVDNPRILLETRIVMPSVTIDAASP